MLLALLAAATVMGQDRGDDETVNVDDVQEDVVRDLFDKDGRMENTDQRAARIAQEYEGGFGGYYFDDTDKSTVYVYMVDPSETEAAEGAFRSFYRGGREPNRIIPVQGDYPFDVLLNWFHALDTAMVRDDIHPTTGAVLEISNRILFGLDDMGQVEEARRIMEDLGIPKEAVIFEEARAELLANGDSVNAKWRPLTGGIQHKIRFDSAYCTVGFTTERNNVDGLVVASHCTNTDHTVGGIDDANIYQPSRHVFQNNKVAVEDIDPNLRSINHWMCPENYGCRYSDAAFADLESGFSLDVGHVAQPEDIRETDVSPAGTTFEITREASGVSVDDEVYYIGATTGWRTGEVRDDCTYFRVKYRVRIICVGRAVINDGGLYPTGGDSGGPVIAPDSGDEVDLVGTVFARSGSQFYFSKVGYIYMELGSSATWDSCTSGC